MKSLIILPCLQVSCAFICFILHVVATSSNSWGTYYSRVTIPEERGSYGFWTVCSNVHSINLGISWNCDPMSTMFRPPPLMSAAGVLAVIHVVLIVLFFPISILRVLQILKNRNDFLLSSTTIGIIKVSLAILCTIFAALVLILTTVREEVAEQTIIYRMAAYKHYTIIKSWAFWLEVTVISIEVPLVIFCAIENTQLMKVDALIKWSDIASMQSLPRTSPYFHSSSFGQQDIHSARPAHVISQTSPLRPTSYHQSRPQTSSSQNSTCTSSCPIHCCHRAMNGNRSEKNPRHTLRPYSPATHSILNTHLKSFADRDEKCTSGNCYHSNTSRSSRIQRESIEVTRRDRNLLSSPKHVKISQSCSPSSNSPTPRPSPTNTFLNSVFEDLPTLTDTNTFYTSARNQKSVTERY